MSPTGPTPAEQHLGDRLAALVDGELKHDARERVLAHLATCSRCKAEADAQRRLKSAFAASTPPPPSEGFLARLQGLPAGSGGGGGGADGPFGGAGRFGEDVFPVTRHPRGRPGSAPGGFGYLPTAHGSTAVLPGGPVRAGFPVHGAGREADRSSLRARRFAFAAAGAVSLAAIALGGTLPLEYAPETPLRAEGAGTTATPLDEQTRTGGGSSAASRSGGGALAVGDRSGRSPAPVPPASAPPGPVLVTAPSPLLVTAPLLGHGQVLGHGQAFPALNVTVPPLISPTDAGPLFSSPPGRAADPRSVPPSATASASPPSADRAIPLSPLR
ncbi:anti-sigma factor family protein [Streptomyces nitrosporeus]|uniref:anti-sigma factor family protein n=1 Tax=Streptomyces nitrosporeus TaxID=28894 RepID=UPI0039A17A43